MASLQDGQPNDLSMPRFLGDTIRQRPFMIILPTLLTFFGPVGGLFTRMTGAEYAKVAALGVVAGLGLLVLLLRPMRRQWGSQWQGRVTHKSSGKLDTSGLVRRTSGAIPIPATFTIEGLGNRVVSDAEWASVDVGTLLVKDAGCYGWRVVDADRSEAADISS